MASPVGHAIVGVAAASAVAGAAGAPSSYALWIGSLAASILPDFDLALEIVGLKGPRFHRNASHSFVVLGLFMLAVWVLHPLVAPPVDPRIGLAWAAALISHPILDVFTTGPVTANAGYGIALFWPFHRRRWSVRRPIFESLNLSKCRSLSDVWQGVRPEVTRLGPVAAVVVVLAFAF